MTMVRKEIALATILLVSILVNSAFASAITGSMGNARMILYPEVDGSKEVKIDKTILVKNINDVPINVTLVLDGDAEKFIQLVDKSFIMDANTEKNARFTVKVTKEGKYEGRINVFFSPVGSKEAGVVLSSTVIVIAKEGQLEDNGDDTNIENDDSNNEDGTPITGGAVGSSKKSPSLGVIFLIITTILLFVVLIALIVIAPKKLKSSKNSNKGGKR